MPSIAIMDGKLVQALFVITVALRQLSISIVAMRVALVLSNGTRMVIPLSVTLIALILLVLCVLSIVVCAVIFVYCDAPFVCEHECEHLRFLHISVKF